VSVIPTRTTFMTTNNGGDGGWGVQNLVPVSLSDVVGFLKKKSSTPGWCEEFTIYPKVMTDVKILLKKRHEHNGPTR
jgi:hypothetical protein